MENLVNNYILTQKAAFVDADALYGKKINTVHRPEKNIGIDLTDLVLKNVAETYNSSLFDINSIESFTRVSLDRETLYQLLDTMSEDSIVSAILEIYAEDSTETNDKGLVVWAESDSPEVHKYVSYLLDSMSIDKNIYKWAYSLCKYGDLYLRLYHQSDIDDGLFDNSIEKDKKQLNEDVILKAYRKSDKFVHYVEMVPNPAEMFELMKFGKTYAYIQAPTSANMTKRDTAYSLTMNTYKYSFKKKDVFLFLPTEFVHAALEDNLSRIPEEVEIFKTDDISYNNALSYNVRRGLSLLYNAFKIWREMMLLENSLLLNRLTKSSVVRVINVEVGDMPKEQIGPHLMGIKQLFELKAALATDNSIKEYTNPGPAENNIYVPSRNGQGSISTLQVGGDVDVKGLSDIDYFKNKFYGCLRIPKQFLGDTDDGAGFNGGTSLSIISSRYAKAIKRILNTLCQSITDIINIMLIDKGLDSYINKFTIRMQEPTTQEEMDRRNNLSTKVQVASDIMNLVGDIDDTQSRLKLLKSLISNIVQDSDIILIIQDKIESLENSNDESDLDDFSDDFDDSEDFGSDFSMPSHSTSNISSPSGLTSSFSSSESSESSQELIGELPSPADLGAGDFTDNSIGD